MAKKPKSDSLFYIVLRAQEFGACNIDKKLRKQALQKDLKELSEKMLHIGSTALTFEKELQSFYKKYKRNFYALTQIADYKSDLSLNTFKDSTKLLEEYLRVHRSYFTSNSFDKAIQNYIHQLRIRLSFIVRHPTAKGKTSKLAEELLIKTGKFSKQYDSYKGTFNDKSLIKYLEIERGKVENEIIESQRTGRDMIFPKGFGEYMRKVLRTSARELMKRYERGKFIFDGRNF